MEKSQFEFERAVVSISAERIFGSSEVMLKQMYQYVAAGQQMYSNKKQQTSAGLPQFSVLGLTFKNYTANLITYTVGYKSSKIKIRYFPEML